MTAGPPRPRAQSVLFVCSENAVRSPMAEALTRLQFGRGLYVSSAGVRPGDCDPFTAAVMEELGIDLSRHRPKRLEDLDETSFDLFVTLSPEAHHRTLDFTRSMAVDVVYWPTFDATATEGSRDTVLDAYRGVRDGLRRRIRTDFDWRPVGSV